MPNPSLHDLLHRRQAVARTMAFENLNFAQQAISSLLRGEVDEDQIPRAKTLIRTALYKSRRNAESAKFLGCALYRV